MGIGSRSDLSPVLALRTLLWCRQSLSDQLARQASIADDTCTQTAHKTLATLEAWLYLICPTQVGSTSPHP